MAEWSAVQLTAIAENSDLFVSPFREDGTIYGPSHLDEGTRRRRQRLCAGRQRAEISLVSV